jgi:hypothetical protein
MAVDLGFSSISITKIKRKAAEKIKARVQILHLH